MWQPCESTRVVKCRMIFFSLLNFFNSDRLSKKSGILNYGAPLSRKRGITFSRFYPIGPSLDKGNMG